MPERGTGFHSPTIRLNQVSMDLKTIESTSRDETLDMLRRKNGSVQSCGLPYIAGSGVSSALEAHRPSWRALSHGPIQIVAA